jgi:hypothetical protein
MVSTHPKQHDNRLCRLDFSTTLIPAHDMSEKTTLELNARTSDNDAIAAREAQEDARIKAEQRRTGGALEVVSLHQQEKCIADFVEAIHQRLFRNKLLFPAAMLMGGRGSHVPILARKWRTSIHRLRQHLCLHWYHSNSRITRGDGIHGSNCRRTVSLDSSICSTVQQVLWAHARLDHDLRLDLLLYLKRGAHVQHHHQPRKLQQRRICTAAMAFDADHVGANVVSVHWQLLAPEIHQHPGNCRRCLSRYIFLCKYCDIGCNVGKEPHELCLQYFDSRRKRLDESCSRLGPRAFDSHLSSYWYVTSTKLVTK